MEWDLFRTLYSTKRFPFNHCSVSFNNQYINGEHRNLDTLHRYWLYETILSFYYSYPVKTASLSIFFYNYYWICCIICLFKVNLIWLHFQMKLMQICSSFFNNNPQYKNFYPNMFGKVCWYLYKNGTFPKTGSKRPVLQRPFRRV